MGLFMNKKKLCPICGNPTPRLFPREFDEQPICKECENKIDLPGEILDNMSLDDFRQYLVAYEENEALRSIFHETYRYGGGLFSSDALFLDEENGLIRLKTTPKGWAIEKQYLKSFRIFEDDNLLFESGEGTLNCYPSEIPARAEALRPAVSAFHVEKQAYERREQLEMARNRNETDEQRRERERIAQMYRPQFEDPNLFWGFRVEITFDHPYRKSYTDELQGPTFSESYPDIDDYLKSYSEQTEQLHLLATRLMHMIAPDADETQLGSVIAQTVYSTATAPVDAVVEIQRFKDLMDQGIITEEEFSEKKRQLLGI